MPAGLGLTGVGDPRVDELDTGMLLTGEEARRFVGRGALSTIVQ